MEYQNTIPDKKMKTQCQSSDIISTLPQNIIENILSLIPIRDALRTSILSKKWRYTWRGMPKLVFTDKMVKVPSDCGCFESQMYKLVNIIFHVLLLHNGPTILKFDCLASEEDMEYDFSLIFSYLSRRNTVKELIFFSDYYSYEQPISLFLLQGLELLHLEYSTFKLPSTFNGFSRLKNMTFNNVEVFAETLQRFLSKCPLLEHISLDGNEDCINYVERGNNFTFVDLSQCVPLIQSLNVSEYYTKDFSAVGMPHKLPTSLIHLKHLILEVCLMEQNEISSALCMIRSAPVLEKINLRMYDNDKLHVQQTPTDFLDLENHSDLKLDHLETLEIGMFGNLPLEIKFVKLVMARSPVQKKVKIMFHYKVSVGEEMKILKDLGRLPLPRASPSAELIIKCR